MKRMARGAKPVHRQLLDREVAKWMPGLLKPDWE